MEFSLERSQVVGAGLEEAFAFYVDPWCRAPGGPLAPLVRRGAVGRWLDEIFDYRAVRVRGLPA